MYKINKNDKKGEFVIYRTNDAPKISLTVALPAFNAKKIIWLALESLIRQRLNKNIFWELIICEEYGESKDIVKQYIKGLRNSNCAKLTYIFIDPKVEGIIKNKYTLLEKWLRMAKKATPSSKALVLMACDIYSHYNRLQVHYNHFQNNNCIISTQPIGPFYNIKNGKQFIYDGELINGKTRLRHLNMAFKIDYMKKIKIVYLKRSIDNYIQNDIIKQMKGKFDNNKNIFYDNSDNWKYGFDTDGYNNISKSRKQFYDTDKNSVNRIINYINKIKQNKKNIDKNYLKKINIVYWCLPLYENIIDYYQFEGIEKYVPYDVIVKLKNMD